MSELYRPTRSREEVTDDELLIKLDDRLVPRRLEREDFVADLAHDDGKCVTQDRVCHDSRLAHGLALDGEVAEQVVVV